MIVNLTDKMQLALPSYFPTYLEVGLILFTFLVLLITLFLAYQRLKSSLRFTMVALLNVLSFCALLGLISDIKIQTDTQLSGTLLTYGTSQKQVNSLPVDENTTVFILSSTSSWQSSLDLSRVQDNLIIIDNASEVFLSQPFLSQLNVYGDGLLPQQWQMIGNMVSSRSHENIKYNRINVDFFPSKIRTGPIKLYWPKQLVLGQPFYISGKFRSAINDKERIFKITLSDLHDETVDQLTIKNNEKFYLSASIKNQGLFTYQLKVFDDEQQLILAEPVAFTVSSSEQIKVAIKQSSASFESKYLKNWLAEQGEETLLLTQVSKDKYIQQTVNSTADKSSEAYKESNSIMTNKELATSWLKHFDLLYMDGRAFNALSEKEVVQLDIAIKQGLGLIIMSDDELLSSSNKVLSHFLLGDLLDNALTNSTFQVNAKGENTLNTIPRWLHSKGEHTMSYKNIQLPTALGKVLIKGSEGQALWVKYSHGLGSIAFSLIDSSYKWVISGEKMHYSQYWQTIIEQVSRQKQSSGWQDAPKDKIYFQGQTQKICAQLNVNDVDSVKVKKVNLLKSPVTESAYCGVYWANTTGWHTFTLANEEHEVNQKQESALSQKYSPLNTQSLFLYAHHNWLTWQQFLKHEASALTAHHSSKTPLEPIYISANKTAIWWLLFITLSLLWFERKVF
mgnify:CR=1 FL=1